MRLGDAVARQSMSALFWLRLKAETITHGCSNEQRTDLAKATLVQGLAEHQPSREYIRMLYIQYSYLMLCLRNVCLCQFVSAVHG